jgi:hypothetical protein
VLGGLAIAAGIGFLLFVAANASTGADAERIVCERVYFDSATILRQLGLVPGPPDAS